jgi:hypothetical protein
MGCPGRRRKNGAREANGRLKRLKAAERKALIGERAVVLAQPHRRHLNGEALSQLAESPLGQFILKHGLRRELYDAGLEFGSISRRCLRARGTCAGIIEAYTGTGKEMSTAAAVWLKKELERLEKPLRRFPGFPALRQLAIFERGIPEASRFTR